MDKTPVYQLPFDYAQAHDECAQYNASLDANIACKEAIETAIGRYYGHNRLGAVPAVRDVVKQFGYERTLYVLANTVQRLEHDGRISRKNKEWAWKTPFGADPKCAYFIITNCHPGLLNIFLDTARHEYLLSQPIKRADIKAEASHILEQFQEAVEPNSPNGTHFMARVAPDFWARAKQKDRDKGIYALISKDEDRSKPLILRKPSVRKKLREAAEPSKASGPSKNREPER